MTDQPETIEEYYIRKVGRVMLDIFIIWMANMWALGSILAEPVDPQASAILTAGAALAIAALLIKRTGSGRRLLNRIPGKEFTELRRPGEVTTEVPADD